MFAHEFELSDGTVLDLVMPTEQGRRLAGTCFRGISCRQAGNFFRWECFQDFLKDQEVRDHLVDALQVVMATQNVNIKHRLDLEFSEPVGWDSVVELTSLKHAQLERLETRALNKRASASFLPTGLIPAPLTEVVTMVGRLKHDGKWCFIIDTIYPGEDAGVLEGDMTVQHGLVWLNWDNVGEVPEVAPPPAPVVTTRYRFAFNRR